MKKVLLLMFLCGAFALAGGKVFKERIFYMSSNMTREANLKQMELLAVRARKAGYNTVLLGDYKFGHPWRLGEPYKKNVQRIVSALRKNGLRIIAGCAPIGDNCSFLTEAPELAECLKVVDEPYTVIKGIFTPVDIMQNGSFEEGLKNWRPDPKVKIALDCSQRASGKNSLYFKVSSKDPYNQIRVWTEFATKPFQQYELSFKVKTKDLQGTGSSRGVGVALLGKVDGVPEGFRYLSYRTRNIFAQKPLKSTQDWQEYRFFFNTYEFNKVSIAIGCWGGKSGEFRIDDVKLRPASFMNVLRRPGMGVKVKSADGKVTYTEGRDYSKIVDPKAGNYRWRGDYGDFHTAPQIRILPGSRIKEGQKILASYYYASLSQKHACICINHPMTKKFLTRQIQWIQKVIRPDGFMIGIDEHRAYGYDPECEKSGLSAAQALNMIAKYTHKEIKRIAPQARIYMWNDMFDPFANCRRGRFYYMIKGKDALWNSWEGLPKDIIIMRWSPSNPKTHLEGIKGSMEHWRKLGMKFIEFPGYFDGPVFNRNTEKLLDLAKKNPACIGAAFAQWSGLKNFRPHFEKFIKVLDQAEKRK